MHLTNISKDIIENKTFRLALSKDSDFYGIYYLVQKPSFSHMSEPFCVLIFPCIEQKYFS